MGEVVSLLYHLLAGWLARAAGGRPGPSGAPQTRPLTQNYSSDKYEKNTVQIVLSRAIQPYPQILVLSKTGFNSIFFWYLLP